MKVEVIIPTVPGRERYLRDAIQSCLSQAPRVDLSVLVSNNGGAESTKQVVEELADPRIRYAEPDAFLPMPLHWDFALKQSNGEVMTILGDDDALMPGALSQVSEFFDANRDIAALAHFPAQYYWPDFLDVSLRSRYFAKRGDGTIEVRSSKEALSHVLSFERWYGTLPFLYHGFVRRDALRAIADRQGGDVFIKAAPDIYSDLALAAVIDRYAVLSGCLTIGGQSAKSTGANFAQGTAEGALFLKEMPTAYLTPYNAKCLNFYMYDYFMTVLKVYGLSRTRPISWRRFIDGVCREAVVLPRDTTAEIARQMVEISRTEFGPTGQLAAILAASIIRFPPAAQFLGELLRRRQKYVFSNWQDASGVGVTSTWGLAQWLESNPDAW